MGIPARVMQPEVSTRGKQNWRIALCSYGMTFAPRHHVHLCVSNRLCTSAVRTGSVLPGRTLLEGEGRVGSRASSQLQRTLLFSWRWPAGVPVPVLCER
jgi:hypothetical protein